MIKIESTIDEQEVNKFAQHAKYWWDSNGPLKTLHDINQTRLDFITSHINLEGMSVLDVGCGGGILSESMAKQGAQVTGLDAEAEAIEAAKVHANTTHLAINYVCMPIEHFEDQTFDVVTCMEMLEHVQHPEVVLAHCKRLLKPGGLLLVSTISRTLKAYTGAVLVAEYVLGLLPKQTHDFDKFIKPSELAAIARSLDLQLIDMQGMSYNPITRQATLSKDVSVNYLMACRLG